MKIINGRKNIKSVKDRFVCFECVSETHDLIRKVRGVHLLICAKFFFSSSSSLRFELTVIVLM